MRKCESLAKNIENSWHVATRIHGVGIHAIDYFAIGIRGRNRREREGEGEENGREEEKKRTNILGNDNEAPFNHWTRYEMKFSNDSL